MINSALTAPHLDDLRADKSWSFADCTPSQTRYITHGYHTYPAKFIPQLAARLIREFTEPREIVVDPFMGSGTTIVEAMVQGRVGVGVDINPVAHLIAKVKCTPVDPLALEAEYSQLRVDLESQINHQASIFGPYIQPEVNRNGRIDYWFPPNQKESLSVILSRIFAVEDGNIRDFFLVAFSQILKSCSIWLQRSVKPTRDPKKVPTDPYVSFLRHAKLMLRRNEQFWNLLDEKVRANPSQYRTLKCADARSLPLGDGIASLVVTSPPYVTSYEYADLHQLTALWFEYFDSLNDFRKQFIGTAHSERSTIDLRSETAEEICHRLERGRKEREVRNYFADMLECFQEMNRVLEVSGKACIVIGNTQLQDVDILNAEVFVEQMRNLGFETYGIVKREIPSKILPQTRDPLTGQFTSSDSGKKKLAYPHEYILIMQKA